MDLSSFQLEQLDWQQYNFPDATSVEPLLGIGEETGELMHAHLKGIQGIRHTDDEIHELKKDAVGDILIYMAAYCNMEGLDMGECLEDTWTKVRQRDWQANKKDGNNGS
jgi:NTP pyrophosphatase (non-canonical NTP hydrolase)